MDELIKKAKLINPLFDNLTSQQQYNILKQLEPKITPEDLVYHYEQQYFTYNDITKSAWDNYLQNY